MMTAAYYEYACPYNCMFFVIVGQRLVIVLQPLRAALRQATILNHIRIRTLHDTSISNQVKP
eukprot:3581674-Pyramimonas_sp.AAC.1